MSDADRLGWGSLQAGLFGVTIAATATDTFSEFEVLSMSLMLVALGTLGMVFSMAIEWFDLKSGEVIGQ